jgi:hypothetical protein
MDYVPIISAALADLEAAANKMKQNTSPVTPLPRVRRFEIVAGKITWPNQDELRSMFALGKTTFLGDWNRKYVIKNIIEACGGQPRLILRALRRIQAATAWCEARAEGRQRAAEEILRQQARAVEALEVEAAMLALK